MAKKQRTDLLRGTLDLLLTTDLSSREIILGKLSSQIAYLFLLLARDARRPGVRAACVALAAVCAHNVLFIVVGRTGYYDEDHVARLELIKDMQADGFNLRAIRHALDALPAGAGPEALEFRRRVVAPWTDEEQRMQDDPDQ